MRLVPHARSAVPVTRAPAAIRSIGLVVALTAVVCFSGCSNKYMYYQTRYTPTSSEQSFSPSARLFWTENDEVYELPSNPPAVASVEGIDDHRSRIDCKTPGPAFKPEKIAAYGPGQAPGRGEIPASDLAHLDDRRELPPAPRRPPTEVAALGNEHLYGPNEPRPVTDIGGSDEGPYVKRNTEGTLKAHAIVGIGADNGWCPPK